MSGWYPKLETKIRYNSTTGEREDWNDVYIYAADDRCLGIVCTSYPARSPEQKMEIANKMAAAPELYQSLSDMMFMVKDPNLGTKEERDKAYKRALEVIKKAGGEDV